MYKRQLVQLPLPKHLSSELVIAAISPEKDVDGFHVVSAGSLLTGRTGFRPCTPYGVMKLLEEAGCDPAGKHAVVIGRSNIVGKPQALMLLEKNASVTIVHSRTTDLAEHTRRADILVAAVGRAKMVKADMVKPGAVVIDVGMNRDENGKLCLDKAKLIVYSHGEYLSLGKTLGTFGYSVRKKRPGKRKK